MVRKQNAIDIINVNVIGDSNSTAAGDAFTTRLSNPNGLLQCIELEVSGATTCDVIISAFRHSGTTIENYLDVGITGTSIFYPRVTPVDSSGTVITDAHEAFALRGGILVGATNLAENSGLFTRVFWI